VDRERAHLGGCLAPPAAPCGTPGPPPWLLLSLPYAGLLPPPSQASSQRGAGMQNVNFKDRDIDADLRVFTYDINNDYINN
jgi:hypothetical protein